YKHSIQDGKAHATSRRHRQLLFDESRRISHEPRRVRGAPTFEKQEPIKQQIDFNRGPASAVRVVWITRGPPQSR
ncbi:hypothetical protein, partial [Mesorhizobium sp. M8A.F.Ca.ET.021.01.1.1]|uniref:hypothetical protein n=1 Tax=Mesorhizobium sp. M8A.F.Ca.ET.021.01.1.1 TaxID=2496757 RepID=UPI001AECDEC6